MSEGQFVEAGMLSPVEIDRNARCYELFDLAILRACSRSGGPHTAAQLHPDGTGSRKDSRVVSGPGPGTPIAAPA
jgi:hypothetical protein